MTEPWNVKTSDGGTIAVWIDGDGPPLVLVHGSVSDHTAFDPLVGELRGDFTVFAMDRRGFGASPDAAGYSAEREFSDVAAVVNAVVARTGEPVVLFGHSWGASCALGAALTAAVVAGTRSLRAQPGPSVSARFTRPDRGADRGR